MLRAVDSTKGEMERFKETLFAALRCALSRAHQQSENGNHSTLGKFLMGQTDELVGSPVAESDGFVVDLSLRFSEILRSTQVLNDIVVYLKRFPPGISRSRYLNYHVRSYLQEMYILRERLNALLKKYERWNSPLAPNSDTFTTLSDGRNLIAKAFDRIVDVRGGDVHHRQFSDPELERLEGWEGLVEGGVDPGKEWMTKAYEDQIKTARERWMTQIETNNATIAQVLDVVFDSLFGMTFAANGEVIIPKSYRPPRGRE